MYGGATHSSSESLTNVAWTVVSARSRLGSGSKGEGAASKGEGSGSEAVRKATRVDDAI